MTTTPSSRSAIGPLATRPAQDAHDAFGMNVHFGFQRADNTNSFVEPTVDLLLELGVGRVRQKLYCDEGRSQLATRKGLQRLMAAGVRTLAPTLVIEDAVDPATARARMEAYLDEVEHHPDVYDLSLVDAMPGLNEPNAGRRGVPPEWATLTRTAQQALFEAVRARPAFDHVAVQGPPLARPRGGDGRRVADAGVGAVEEVDEVDDTDDTDGMDGSPDDAGPVDDRPRGRRGGMGGGGRLGGTGGRGAGRRGGMGGARRRGAMGGRLGGMGGGGRLGAALGRRFPALRGEGLGRRANRAERPERPAEREGTRHGGGRGGGAGGPTAFAQILAGHAAAVGDLSAWADRADLHIRCGDQDSAHGGPPEAFTTAIAAMYLTPRPVTFSEYGWNNTSPEDPDGQQYDGGAKSCPLSVTAVYAPKAPLNALVRGLHSVYAYEMLDNQPPYANNGAALRQAKSGHIRTPGLDPSTWERKPHFHAMRRFLRLFADPGPAFTPTPLTAGIRADCPDLCVLAFQRRSGEHLLALWRPVDLYHCDQRTNVGEHLSVSAAPVTVELAQPRAWAEHRPSTQDDPVASGQDSRIVVSVGAELSVLVLGVPAPAHG